MKMVKNSYYEYVVYEPFPKGKYKFIRQKDNTLISKDWIERNALYYLNSSRNPRLKLSVSFIGSDTIIRQNLLNLFLGISIPVWTVTHSYRIQCNMVTGEPEYFIINKVSKKIFRSSIVETDMWPLYVKCDHTYNTDTETWD